MGKQFAGRVGMFWRVQDFDSIYQQPVEAGVEFALNSWTELHGRVVVFLDIFGNKWDLIGLAEKPFN